jgi:hypothetical protein
MVGANTLVAWVSPADSSAAACSGLTQCAVTAIDGFASAHTMPLADAKRTDAAGRAGTNDIVLVDATVTAAYRSVVFDRPATPSDVAAGWDADLSPGAPPVHVLWAYGSMNGNAGDGGFPQHARSGFSAAPVNVFSTAAVCSTAQQVNSSNSLGTDVC